MKKLDLDKLETLMKHLQDLYSDTGKERVGFILDNYSFIEVKNVATNPEEGFAVSGEDIKEYAINNAIGTWHTHPNATSNLSGEDYTNFFVWDNLFHLIIGKDGVKLYCYVTEGNCIVEEFFVPRED